MKKPKGPKAFIISLARAKDRREHAISQAEKAGLDWEIAEAIDARDFRNPDGTTDWEALNRVQPFDNSKWGCQFRASEVAIYASHLSVFQRMLNLDIQSALVLEDDFQLRDAPYGLLDVAEELDKHAGWGHVCLHHELLHYNSAYRVLGPWEDCRTLNRIQQSPLILVGTAVSRDFAQAFLAEESVMISPVDHAVCRMSARADRFAFLQTSFSVCGSAGFQSTQE